jgi:plastocyanin
MPPGNIRHEQSDYKLMNMKHVLFRAPRVILYAMAGWACAGPLASQAGTANVTIGDFFFSPPSVTINVNDQVLWTWAGAISHSTTSSSTPRLWDSGLKVSGSFTNTFRTSGSFPYFCTLHSFMTGTVNVQAGNVPPIVSISAPTNGTTFAAPWTGTIRAAVSDTDGTVSKVDFFANASPLGTVSNPPAEASFTVTNLAAGNYTLTALATDNGGATNSSAGVAINVVTPTAINLSSPQRVSDTAFQFNYSAVPGLRYIVLRSDTLSNLLPIRTNTAGSASEPFLDTDASGPVHFYRVQLAPNP